MSVYVYNSCIHYNHLKIINHKSLMYYVQSDLGTCNVRSFVYKKAKKIALSLSLFILTMVIVIDKEI